MKFPKVIRHRKAEVTIYGKKPNYAFYRISYRVAGKRILRNYSKYSEALNEAEKKVRELAVGSQAIALTADQARDALTAFEILTTFWRTGGKRVSLTVALSEYVDALNKLKGHFLKDAIEGFLKTVVTVQRRDVIKAVEEFLEGRKHKAEVKDGKRSQLSASYGRLSMAALNGWIIANRGRMRISG